MRRAIFAVLCFALSAPEVIDYASENRTVDAAAYQPEGVAFADGVTSPERMPAVRTASGVFRILETPPLLGRTLTSADDRPGAPCAVVLSYGLWQERFAGDAGVVGKTLRVNGETKRGIVMEAQGARYARLLIDFRLSAFGIK